MIAISPIFYSIFSSSRKHFCHFFPSVSKVSLRLVENYFFGWSPFSSLDDGVKVIKPALTALLPNTARELTEEKGIGEKRKKNNDKRR